MAALDDGVFEDQEPENDKTDESLGSGMEVSDLARSIKSKATIVVTIKTRSMELA